MLWYKNAALQGSPYMEEEDLDFYELGLDNYEPLRSLDQRYMAAVDPAEQAALEREVERWSMARVEWDHGYEPPQRGGLEQEPIEGGPYIEGVRVSIPSPDGTTMVDVTKQLPPETMQAIEGHLMHRVEDKLRSAGEP